MQNAKQIKTKIILLIIVGVSATIGLLLYALSSNIDLFYTPGEVLYGKGKEAIKPKIDQRIRIGGMVKAGSVYRDPDSLKMTFDVYDLNGIITVHYEGVLPNLFKEEQSVVTQGRLVAEDVLAATEVLAKHDENYVPAEIQQAMKENHLRTDIDYDANQADQRAQP